MKKSCITLITFTLLIIGTVTLGYAANSPLSEPEKKYPLRKIEIIVPLAPGGGTDVLTRAVAEYLAKDWGQPVIVVNKPGGNGLIGAQDVLKSKPDGYTVLAVTPTYTTLLQASTANPLLKMEDHLFMVCMATVPFSFIVKADAPWKGMKDFGEWALKNPEQLTWGSSGLAATSSFVFHEWYQSIGGDAKRTKMVSTTGGGDALIQVAGGHIVLYPSALVQAIPLIEAGKLKAIGLSAPHRDPKMPSLPTFEEQGVKSLSGNQWAGVSAPKGTPEYVVRRWDETFKKMLGDKEFLAKIEKLKTEVSYRGTVDFNRDLKAEVETFTRIAEKIGIRK